MALVCEQMPEVRLVYLFGSRATGTSNNDSDWDIALLDATKLAAPSKWQLSSDLANRLNADVDLVDLREASTVLKMQVVESGQLLFDAGDFAPDFETCVLSMYGNLQEARADIVDNFVRYVKKKGEHRA